MGVARMDHTLVDVSAPFLIAEAAIRKLVARRNTYRLLKPAHQSLLTDVFGSRLLLCAIHQSKNFTMSPREDGKPCAVC
jgi:hypothetical protein